MDWGCDTISGFTSFVNAKTYDFDGDGVEEVFLKDNNSQISQLKYINDEYVVETIGNSNGFSQ